MATKRKGAEIEYEIEDEFAEINDDELEAVSSDEEVMNDRFDSDEDNNNVEMVNESEDSAQYDDEESEEEMSSEEEGVVPNADMKREKLKSVQFDSAKVIKKKERLYKESTRLSRREIAELHREKLTKLKMGMVKPNYALDRNKERHLARIATLGVTTLFNKVLEHKKCSTYDVVVKKEEKAKTIEKVYQAQLDALPRTANKFIVKKTD
uniref:RRP15-like protein n=1 Tax=Parastrongyloides trichosuri TaxID=131310 RepID=A0A0N4Z3H1_PARTI